MNPFDRIGQRLTNFNSLYDDDGPSSTVQESRPMFNNGGMLVQPNADGSRPGYAKVKDKFIVGSGPGTGDALTSDRNTKIVKTALNKIKKQINNKPYFEWSEKSDWYKKLRTQLGGKAEGVGMNRDFTNQLINKVVNENFPGAYHGRSAIANLRRDMVVESFVGYLKDNGEFDGGEKFLKSIEKFKDNKRPDNRFENINKAWKSWIAGEFEVEGVDRAQLAKELEARGISYNQINKWNAKASQKRGLKKKAAIEFLDNQNNKFPNRSFEDVQKLYKQKFPDRNIYLDVNTLTDIKRTGIYKSGDKTVDSYKSVKKGNRANWLKESYGQQFQGNYSKLIKAADQLEAAGEFKKAKRISDAADKFFGPNGIITNAKGEGEHALARTFDLLNPDRQLAVNSLVSGDLNQFKKNFFDVPVKRYFDEYNNPETTTVRRKELKNLIEERKKIMNSLTGGQKNGIVAGDIVNFRYGPNQITVSSSVEALDTKFKKGEFDIQEYIDRGNSYDEVFRTVGSEANIFTKTGDIKSTYSKPINEKKANILSAFCNSKRKGLKLAGSVDGLTCSMEEIQTNMKKQINEAAKVSKDGKIPKKFGKLTGLAKTFFGDVAIPLEYMFMAPDLVAGDIEGQDIFANQLARAEKNMADIIKDYQSFGYTYEPGEKGFSEGKVAAQKLIRDKVTSDFDKKIDKAASTEFFKDSNKDLLKDNLRSLGGDPFTVTPINNLENYIKNKGEATAGNTNIFFNRLPYTLDQAEAFGVGDIFDTYAGGYAGVETPGSMEDGQVDMGTKDVRDAYSSLPIDLASQLAALEKKEFEEGMLKKELNLGTGFAGGGIAGLSGGDPKGAMTRSMNPDSQGLQGLFNRVKKI